MGYIKQENIVDDEGIHVPVVEYCDETTKSSYRTVLTREDFVKGYVKYILMPKIKNKMRLEGTTWFNTNDEDIEEHLIDGFLKGEFMNHLVKLL